MKARVSAVYACGDITLEEAATARHLSVQPCEKRAAVPFQCVHLRHRHTAGKSQKERRYFWLTVKGECIIQRLLYYISEKFGAACFDVRSASESLKSDLSILKSFYLKRFSQPFYKKK